MQTLLLNSDDVDENARMDRVIDAVRGAFTAYERGNAKMPAKSYIDLPEYDGDFRSMPAYLDVRTEDTAEEAGWDAAGIKWVNVHTDNPADHDLPTVMGTMIYSDPETAFPLAVLDGTTLTMKRTGAAAAVATDELAVPDATSLGIVGAGVQSYTQLEAIAAVRDIDEVVISDLDEERVADFINAFDDRFDEEGYLSTGMSYRVDESYIPCLLVLWADRAGHGTTQLDDGTVLVYDSETLVGELENVVAYNLEGGESIAFDELRERFLSAPVPDAALADIATAELDDATVADDHLTKS